MEGRRVDSLPGGVAPFHSHSPLEPLMDIQLLPCDDALEDQRDPAGSFGFASALVSETVDFDLPELGATPAPAFGTALEDSSVLISLQNDAAAVEFCSNSQADCSSSRSNVRERMRGELADRDERQRLMAMHMTMNSAQKCGSAFGAKMSRLSCFLNANDDSSSASFLGQYSSWQPNGCGRAREPRAKKQTCRSKLPQRVPSRTQSQRHNHILAERQRREEMNEKFSILRTILPKLTKKDKASIVTDTINYVRELEKMVRHLQACKSSGINGHKNISNKTNFAEDDVEAINPAACDMKESRICAPQVEVQNLGSRAIIKVICSRSPGLVLRTHKALDECKVDVLQSNVTTLGSNSVHYFTVQVNPGVSASEDELISALQHATATG